MEKKDTEGLSIRQRKAKKDRDFPEIWPSNGHLWKPHNIDARFSVHGGGKVPDLLKGFMAMLEAEGLTPETLDGFLVFMTTMNDADKWDKEDIIRAVMEVLKRIPQGHCLIVGPGNDKIWCIADDNWQKRADKYMGILEEAGHPVMKSEHTYDMMITNVKKNDPYHMLDTPHNELHGITMMVTHCKFLFFVCQHH